MSKEKEISLINCDFTKKNTRLTSPRSLIACRLIGVTQDDLIYQEDIYVLKNKVNKKKNKFLSKWFDD